VDATARPLEVADGYGEVVPSYLGFRRHRFRLLRREKSVGENENIVP
jgi:hypothetical protein